MTTPWERQCMTTPLASCQHSPVLPPALMPAPGPPVCSFLGGLPSYHPLPWSVSLQSASCDLPMWLWCDLPMLGVICPCDPGLICPCCCTHIVAHTLPACQCLPSACYKAADNAHPVLACSMLRMKEGLHALHKPSTSLALVTL